MTDADLQLTQLFRDRGDASADHAFAERVMQDLAVQRRKILIMRLLLQAVGLVAVVAVAATTPAIFESFAIADFGGAGRPFAMAACLAAAGAAVVAPLLSRARA